MPNSLRCKIKHLCHNGTLTERERDRILKALEQEPTIDKIRAEIMAIGNWNTKSELPNGYLVKVIEIIDKYKAESEG